MFTGKFNCDSAHFRAALCQTEKCIPYLDDEVNIAFWGVLYNKKKLGVDTVSSDAKAVALLYKSKGISVFSELDGSFTFIILTGNKLMLVRDHHGTSNQVYYNNSHFASSLAALQDTPDFSTEVDSQALRSFLSVGYIPTGSSAFRGVKKLGAGSLLLYYGGKQEVINLFDPSIIVPSNDNSSLETLSEQYGNLHVQAINRRIGNSQNVGILLSGGYDSGCNLAALRKNYNGQIRSYSIGFKGDNWSELPLAKCMSEAFGTVHHQYEIDGSEIMALPDIIRELGDPFVEGGLMVNYAAMRMIGDSKPDVILGGDGSDQYFGTSGREVAMHYLAGKYGVKPLLTALHSVLSRDMFDKNNKSYRVRFHLDKILNILQGDMFGFESFKLDRLLQDGRKNCSYATPKADLRSFEHLYSQHAYITDIEKVINQVILFKATRMAEMFDNKIAFPYMDLELYNFLKHLPVKYKCKGDSPLSIAKGEGAAKFLLKYHYKPMLPEAITSKKKQGGFAPMPIFFQDKQRRDLLSDFIMQSSVVNDFLNRKAVESFIKRYDSECDQPGNRFWYKQNKAIQFFNLLTLSIWWEQYVKGNRSITL